MMSKKDRTRQQMEEEMRQLRKVFMTVRLMKADEVQGGKKGSAPCYAQWRRSRPCENCVARPTTCAAMGICSPTSWSG